MRRAAILLGYLAWCHPAAAQAVDWRGAYIGGFAGAAWTNSKFATELTGEWGNLLNPGNQVDRDAILPLLNDGVTGVGATGGAAVGYNWLYDSLLLLGFEADVSVLDGKTSTAGSATGVSPYEIDTSAEINWVATVRGRLGITFDRSLIYVTGGLGIGERQFSQSIVQLNFPFVETGRANSTGVGWVLGGGLEHALGSEWSLRLQYLHIDLGSESADSVGVCPPPSVDVCAVYTGSHKVDFALDTVTAGVIYRFGAP